MDPDEIAHLQEDGVVGDVCKWSFCEDESTDMDLNKRASGPSSGNTTEDSSSLRPWWQVHREASTTIGRLHAGVITSILF